MRKFLLVVLIGMAFVINVYGVINEYLVDQVEEVDHIKETTTTVYME